MSIDFQKPDKKKVRGFSLSPETSDLIDKLATEHGVPASRIVDKALEMYLKTLLVGAPE